MKPQQEAFMGPEWKAVPLVEVQTLDGTRVVRVGAKAVACYPAADPGMERITAVNLAVAGIKARHVAAAFDITPQHLSRLRGRARRQGSAGLASRKRGPQGPSRLTPALRRRIQRLRAQGLTVAAIAARVGVSVGSVSAALREPAPAQPALPLPAAPAADPTPPAVPATPQPVRFAGAMLLLGALQALGLFQAFQTLGASVGRAWRYDWARTVAVVALVFGLRLRSIERLKTVLPIALGPLVGCRRAPTAQTLRTKLLHLAESVDPQALHRELLRALLAYDPVWEQLYYVDGHFAAYHGQHPAPEGWDARRRVAAPGHSDAFVHDAHGRALFAVHLPCNEALSRVLPQIVAEIRAVVGPQARFTLVFDRGGFSGQVFRWLTPEGLGFLTYLKGRAAQRRFPARRFTRRWWTFEGKRRVYRLYEKGTRVAKAGLVRTVIWQTPEGSQVPVLTNRAEWPAPKLVHVLRLRWRQENSLKYLSDNYAIDQLIQYGADAETDARPVGNPARRALRERLARLRQELGAGEAELGRALAANPEAKRRTVRGLKIALAPLRRKVAALAGQITRLVNRLRHTPAQVPRTTLEPRAKRAILRHDRRHLVMAIKVAACDAEHWLGQRFNQSYRQAKDYLTMTAALFQQPGTLHLAHGVLHVRIVPPADSRAREAFTALCTDLNDRKLRWLNTDYRLHFEAAVNRNTSSVGEVFTEF
jgi:transposase